MGSIPCTLGMDLSLMAWYALLKGEGINFILQVTVSLELTSLKKQSVAFFGQNCRNPTKNIRQS